MKQKRTFVTLLLVIGFLCLGIAYAAITGVTLNINGSASAIVGDGQINVQFIDAGVKSKPEGSEATATIDAGDSTKRTVTIDVSELTTAGQSVTFELDIENKTTDIAATLEDPIINWTNKEWFDVDCSLSGRELGVYSATEDTDTQTATVTVTLLKTPVTAGDASDAVAEDIEITIDAEPVANS